MKPCEDGSFIGGGMTNVAANLGYEAYRAGVKEFKDVKLDDTVSGGAE